MVARRTRRAGATKPKGLDAAAELAPSAAAVKVKAKAKSESKSKSASPPKPRALVRRIYKTIDGELTKLEAHRGTSSQDRERASRALSQMVSSLEKAIDMQRDIAGKGRNKSSKDKEALAHAEDLRRQIAERLERLNRKRDAQRRAE